jgi:hypothetical protein
MNDFTCIYLLSKVYRNIAMTFEYKRKITCQFRTHPYDWSNSSYRELYKHEQRVLLSKTREV